MKQVKLFFGGWAFIAAGIFTGHAAPTEKPNVIMLAVDDWNDMIGAFGYANVKTPNIDKVCQMGVRFTNAHTPGEFCTPSRTALLTGVAPWKSGAYANEPHLYNMPERKSIPGIFKSNGYQVHGDGKVFHHMPGYVDLKAYDSYFHWNPEQKKKRWGLKSWEDNRATPTPLPYSEIARATYEGFDMAALPNELEKEMADTKLCDWAVEFLKKKHDKSFFLSIGLFAPHKPNFIPQKYFDLYPLSSIQLPAVSPQDDSDLPAFSRDFIRKKASNVHNKIITVNDGWKKGIQGYLAAISYADAQLGRILDMLEKSPYAQNTIIVFWSDNGYHLGEKNTWAKHTLWERTTNVPMIWAGPGIEKNKEYKGVTSLLDIYPTLVAMCRLQDKQQADGVSIVPTLANPGKVTERAVITVKSDGQSFSVFTNDWHYINYEFGKGEELYNAKEDKDEWKNLATDPQYKAVVQKMTRYLPKNPAPPAIDKDQLNLVFEDETFKWVKQEKKSVLLKKRE